ncbi:hypothetical protein ACFVNQ_06515, partial [Bacillus subtilis]
MNEQETIQEKAILVGCQLPHPFAPHRRAGHRRRGRGD